MGRPSKQDHEPKLESTFNSVVTSTTDCNKLISVVDQTYDSVALSLCKKPGEIHWQLVKIPYNSATGATGAVEYKNVGTEHEVAKDEFKLAVINDKVFGNN